MKFDNALPEVPQELMERLLRDYKEASHDRRMVERGELLDRYTGKNVTGPWKKMFTPNTRRQVILAEQRILKGAVDKVSMVYKKQPEYDFDNTEIDKEIYPLDNRWLDMKKAERHTNLFGTVLIHPVWRHGRLQRDIIWDYWPLCPHDPLIPSAIIYPIAQPTADITIRGDNILAYWDKDRHFLIAEGGGRIPPPGNEAMENPYGILPFVSCHADEQSGEYWVEPPFEDVANVMDELNKGLTEGRLAVTFNSMGQPVIIGATAPDKEIELGVDKVVHIADVAGKLGFESPTANFPGLVEYLRFEMTIALNNHGISPEWSQEGGTPPSGWSLMIRNLSLLENREDDVPYWMVYDNDVYDIERVIIEQEIGKKLPDNRKINFTEINFPLSPEEERNSRDWRLKHGLDSIIDYAIRENPDAFKDRAEALQHILQNKNENRQVGIRQGDEIEKAGNFFERRATNQ